MKNFSLIVILLLFFTINTSAQSDHEKDSLRFITSYTVTKQQIQTISFEGTIDRKKALSAILDKTKKFKVHAVRNPSNNGYHFDWQISELNNPIENQTFFFKGSDFFEVHHKEGQLNVLEDINKLDAKTEIEIIRSYLLPDELLYGLMDLKQPVHTTFEDDGDHFKMYNQETEDLLRIVCYNKKTLFPENTDWIKSYPNMSALDITSVRLTNIKINEELPEEVISYEYYLDKSYKLNVINPMSTDVNPVTADVNTITADVNTITADVAPTSQVPEPKSAMQEATPLILDQKNVHSLLNTELQTAKGWETTIEKFHDKSFLLLGFWSASSAPSMDDLPVVQSLHRDFRKKGLRVFGINCQDFDQKKTMVKKLKQKGITFTTLFGQRKNLKKWELKDAPIYVLMDEDHKIVLQGNSEILTELRAYLDTVN